MKADYAAIVGKGRTTHAIKLPWPSGDEAHLLCGKTGKLTIRYSISGDEEITCKTCARLTPEPANLPLSPPAAVIPDKPLKLTSTTLRTPPAQRPGLNARQRRLLIRNGSRFANA